MNGIIVVDKPAGWTSHDVVAKLRGALRTKRIGHGGTLDPMATGVLPVFVGRATRAAEFCENTEKEYIAGVQFGIVTDTQDTTGKTLSSCKPDVSAKELLAVIPRFLNAQKQIPPMYSAIKIGGKKLYELARRGEEVERPARDIFISEIELLPNGEENARTVPAFSLRVVCSKGTYIRTFCHDIGAALGCGAAMSKLRRIRVGDFALGKAHSLEEVLEAAASGNLGGILLPVDTLFRNHPAITLDENNTQKCKNGAMCRAHNVEDGACRLYGLDGEFLALGEASNKEIRIIKSFFEVEQKGNVSMGEEGRGKAAAFSKHAGNQMVAEKTGVSPPPPTASSPGKRAIALGFFDGMHLGHSALMEKVREVGREKNIIPSAIVFDAHPANIARGTAVPLINSPEDKTWLIRHKFGIDDTILLRFDKTTSKIPWDMFIEYLAAELDAHHLVAGFDFTFGIDRKGNRGLLERKCVSMGLGCDIIPEVNYGGAKVSSTQIRSLIASGDISRANALLGHPHILSDVVRYGYRLGSKLGKPTINMHFEDGVLVPAHGVYATMVYLADAERENRPTVLNRPPVLGVTNIGKRPTVDDSGEITAETHILNFSGNLYGRRIRLEFHEYLRPEIKFSGIEELKSQIQRDCESALRFFDKMQVR